MPDTTIDTLTIKVQGDGQSAVETLDKVAKALEKIKSVSSGGGGNATLKRLDSIKQSINGINVDGISKLNALFETLKNMNKVSIPAKIADRITTIGKSVRSLEGIDFTQLNRMADGLRALRDVQDVRIPNLNANNQDSDRQMIDNLARDVENARQRARGSAGANLNGTVETPVQETTVKTSKGISSITEKIKGAYHGFQNWQKSLQAGNEWINKIGKGMAPITSRVKAVGVAIKESFSGSIIGSFIGKLNEGFRALKRIAMYRLFRTTIKEITEGFKTGIDDMYQYSKATNGEFAQTLDNLASSSLTYKNSLGAIMAPIINLVVPWIDKLLDKLVDVNNYAAMIIAGLSGKSTFTKAVRVTTEYAAAANEASKNTSKVKDKIGQVKDKVDELKRSLAGLDEITIIGEQDVSPVSNSGNINGANSNPLDNGTAAGLDYKNMFVEAPVDMAKVNEFKKKLDQILKVAKLIGLAILAWKLATFISSIAEALTGLGLLKKQILGITLMVTGFTLEFMGVKDLVKNGPSIKNVLMSALGAALGIAGSLLTFGTGPLGWTIGIVVAVEMFLIGSIAAGYEIAQESEMYKRMTEIVEYGKTAAENAKNAFEELKQKKQELDTVFANYAAAETLINQIFDIYEKGNLSAGELETLKAKINVLNGLGLDGLQLEFDETSGTIFQIGTNADGTTSKIKATRDSVLSLTQALKEQAITAALMDLLTESYKKQFAAQLEAEKITKQQNEAQDELNKALEEYLDYYNNSLDPIWIAAPKIGELAGKVDIASKAVDSLREAQEANDKVLEESSGNISSVLGLIENIKSSSNGYTKNFTNATDLLNSSTKQAAASTEDLKKKLQDTATNGSKLPSIFTDFTNKTRNYTNPAIDSTKSLSNSLQNATKDANTLKDTIRGLDGFSGNYSYSYSFGNIPAHAEGGFPEDGLFFANHNELVGQFSNGKTAVANNGQIVEGISQGVESANEEQNSLLREQNRLLRMLLEKRSTIDVTTITNAMSRKNQRDGKVTVPVAT